MYWSGRKLTPLVEALEELTAQALSPTPHPLRSRCPRELQLIPIQVTADLSWGHPALQARSALPPCLRRQVLNIKYGNPHQF